ncbi:MAG: tetratricopeptide repeat protein, partial [Acidobacteria bacterium]|nr:tetratricopeptide repeat protein [Acidobacteriota bacterium]MCA1637826.1 tetratricopeptide repeat protein [Acidobacteriota bacterium]
LLLREGEIVPLTPKVFETLLLLVKNNNRMLSKDEIIETIWADSFVEETNLTSNISRLRKILHASGEQFIETFPKRGYRFRAEVEEIKLESEIVLTRRMRTQIRQIVEETNEEEIAPEYATYLTSVPNNLSAPNSAIIGREREIAEIENLLLQPKTTLLTLTGVGGTGKTRLAQEIALRMLPEFLDGAFFVALDAMRNAELVAPTIAQTLGVKEASGKSIVEMLKNFLQAKQILLVADNFEQVVLAAPFFTEILDNAPLVKILVTSRAMLKIQAEREFCVPPLDLPDNAAQTSLENLTEFESVKLFLERAKSIKPNFAPTNENAPVIAEICLRLEGLPLAIELAAARIKILSPEQISARLENRLKLLTGGSKDLPARRQTMRGVIAWSYDLLEADEKILFRRLAVFAGGFTIEAVESICSPDEIDTLNSLTSLIENNLVKQTETANGESRFRLLEVVREYAQEILATSNEGELIRRNHATFFLKLAQAAEPEILGGQGAKWLALIEEEHNNFRAAFFWAAASDTETAVNLAGALRDFWVLRNQLTEGREWFETALERAGGTPAAARFKLFSGLGQAARFQGDFAAAQKAYQEGLTAGKESNDLRQIAVANRGLAAVVKGQGDFAAARKFYEEALAISREIDEKFGIAVSLNALGDLARVEGDYAAARPLFEESLKMCRELGNKQGVGCTLNNLGAIAFALGDYETARSRFAEGLRMAQELREKITLSYSLDGFAALAIKKGNY